LADSKNKITGERQGNKKVKFLSVLPSEISEVKGIYVIQDARHVTAVAMVTAAR